MPLCLPGLPDGNSTRIYKRKCKEPVKNGTAPHHLALQGASTLRGSLDARQGFKFLPKKMKFTEFFFRQGEAAKRLTIFAEKMKFTEFFFRQGEGMQRPLQSAEADSFPKRGSRECGLSIKRLFDEKNA